MVLAFEPDVLANEARYRAAADLPADGRTTDDPPDAAVRRRNLAVDGFTHWRCAVEAAGPSALSALYAAAVHLVGERPQAWGSLIDEDPARDLERSRLQIEALCESDRSPAASRLHESAVRSRSLLPGSRAMGCCGTLGTVVN
jgi:hypothetical protein